MNDPDTPLPTFGVLILAGGRSSRMGTDKAELPYRGGILLDHMRDLARRAGAVAIRIGGGPQGDLADEVPDAGPVAGLCALAGDATAGAVGRWLVLPVDMPLLSPALLHRLVRADGPAAAFARHPLPLALRLDQRSVAILKHVKERLSAQDSVAVGRVLDLLGAETLHPSAEEQAQLTNANTPEDWRHLIRRQATESEEKT